MATEEGVLLSGFKSGESHGTTGSQKTFHNGNGRCKRSNTS